MTTVNGFDVDRVMAEIRAEVARRRAAGEYDEALLEAVHAEFAFDPSDPPEATAYIAAVRPLISTRPVIGPLIVFYKRVVRRLIAWYVAPIAEDQTRHNIAAIHLMRSLERRLTAVDHAVAQRTSALPATGDDAASLEELARRVRHLEAQLAALTSEAAPQAQPTVRLEGE